MTGGLNRPCARLRGPLVRDDARRGQTARNDSASAGLRGHRYRCGAGNLQLYPQHASYASSDLDRSRLLPSYNSGPYPRLEDRTANNERDARPGRDRTDSRLADNVAPQGWGKARRDSRTDSRLRNRVPSDLWSQP